MDKELYEVWVVNSDIYGPKKVDHLTIKMLDPLNLSILESRRLSHLLSVSLTKYSGFMEFKLSE